jgi:para-nitrobenzyl esterase
MSASGRSVGRTPRFAVGFVFVLVASFAVMTCGKSNNSLNNATILTENGPLEGIVAAQMNQYLGIPYAAAPVGALRWIPPQSFGQWQGVFQATQFGNECPQAGGGDENCLFLNIYTPDLETKHAVMVWIHGGGLTSGAGSDFDPTPLVEGGGVVVVTINYRLGMLGFFAHTALDAEGHLAGNYGFMDQQFALGWVQRNIAAFGGDPDRVTIFGESAGGLSVYSQLASPLAAGLFQRAIAQSGAYAGFSPNYRVQILPIAVAATTGNPPLVTSGTALADAVGCTSQTTACLRGVGAATLVAAQGTTFPTVDGALLTETPGAAFDSGNFNRVPVITGTNHDEYRYFVANDFTLPLANSQYTSASNTVFGPSLAPTVEAEYPLGASPPVNEAELQLAAAGTDGIFACTARRATMGLAQYVTVYAYEFNDENAPGPHFPGLNFPLGAYHSADVEYLFNRDGIPAPLTPDQQQLSQAMISYWTQFANTGDPNSSGQPQWAPYVPASDERQSFVPPTPGVESNFDTVHMCTSFWDSL